MLFIEINGEMREVTKEELIHEVRGLYCDPEGLKFTEPDMAREFITTKLAGMEREIFAAMFLDNKHNLIAYEEMFQGTIDESAVHPREVGIKEKCGSGHIGPQPPERRYRAQSI